ncbi:MAG: DnaJ domain-containing protein [Candidatus Obscuribacterales bacterium]|nr:DnaJ domain-containing protein [Candidatus Obscuribacterales bacterium]
MQEFEEDHYATLEVDEKASPEDIRKAYIRLAKKLHPDRFPNDAQKRAHAQEQFARVTRAHEVVSDATRRAEYDAMRILVKERQAAKAANPMSDNFVSPIATIGSSQMSQKFEVGSNIKWAEKHLARAEELLKNGRIPDAETATKEALRLLPTDPRCHVMMAEVFLAKGWRTIALTEVQAALRVDPKNTEAKALEMKIKIQSAQSDTKGGKKTAAGQAATSSGGSGGSMEWWEQLKALLTKKL